MKFLRKALLPGIIAAGFLGFLGTVGGNVPTAAAFPGDICAILGPKAVEVGSTHVYAVVVEDPDEGTLLVVDIDNVTGDADITSVAEPSDDYEDIAPVNTVGDLEVGQAGDGDEIDDWDDDFWNDMMDLVNGTAANDATQCGDTTRSIILEMIDRGLFEDEGVDFSSTSAAVEDPPSTAQITAIVNSIDANLNSGEIDCDEIRDDVEIALIELGGILQSEAADAANAVEQLCFTDDTRGLLWPAEGFAFFDVTCNEAGIYEITAFDSLEADNAMTITVVCGGDVETGTITALPTSVEINPAIANVAHSLIWVNLLDDQDDPSAPGTKVLWVTDRCAIESSAVDTEDEFEAAEGLFRANNALNPATALAIEASAAATTAPDSASRQQEETPSIRVTAGASTDFAERTVAAVVLHCDPIHAPGVTPGPAVVTAYVVRGSLDNGQVADNDDLVLRTTVTVVGPPAANGVTVTAAPASLACGEKATITVDVKDSIGQPVSDHTWVEAVTNAGGVLAGTGAVAGQAGLVTPVSSTVAETFGGKTTFYLLTSTAHVGKYEVVVTTGGGGGVTGQLVNGGVTTNLLGGLFTTAPISVQVTVECTVPVVPVVVAPAPSTPTTSGPATGQGIRPPSTGDAGLVSTDSNAWVAGAAFAVVAALVVAGFSVKLVRNED